MFQEICQGPRKFLHLDLGNVRLELAAVAVWRPPCRNDSPATGRDGVFSQGELRRDLPAAICRVSRT
jgi:hypothetical protein